MLFSVYSTNTKCICGPAKKPDSQLYWRPLSHKGGRLRGWQTTWSELFIVFPRRKIIIVVVFCVVLCCVGLHFITCSETILGLSSICNIIM